MYYAVSLGYMRQNEYLISRVVLYVRVYYMNFGFFFTYVVL